MMLLMEDDLNTSRARKSGSTLQTVRRIAASFSPYKLRILAVLFAILLIAILGLVTPLLIQRIFDDAIGKGNVRLLVIYVVIMLLTPIVSGIVGIGQSYLNNAIGQDVMHDFRSRLYQHMQSMSLHFFTGTHAGEIQSRLSNDVGGIQEVVTNTATDIVTNIATAASAIIAMIVISPLLTLVSLSLLPFFLWMTQKVGHAGRVTSKEKQESVARLSTMMQETLSVSGILLTKTFGRQKYAYNRFVQESRKLTNLQVRQQLIGRWLLMLVGTFFSVTPAIIYLIAGLQIIHHTPIFGATMTFGTIVAFTALQSRIFFPIRQLLSAQISIQGALALFDRIFEYLDMPVEIQDAPDARRLRPEEVRGEITFRHVTFTYQHDKVSTPGGSSESEEKQEDGEEAQRSADFSPLAMMAAGETEEMARSTLTAISFNIRPGQMAALVGPSGAGKTTITYLVPRLYDVDSGSVEIDGYNVKDIALDSLSESVGVVTQETYLFHASIRENLLFARPDATEEEMIAAAKAAAIHERIMELDDGYGTLVGERGYKLSGGEKQRVAIARAILKDPRILILDEATSALDTQSERLIQAALEPLMKQRTTLAIAHRLSTILAADVILVVDRGEIVERGTHYELLERGGLYARLYKEQFAQPVPEEASAWASKASSS